MRLVYKCGYDGRICDYVIPQINDYGYIVNVEENRNGTWLECIHCKNNHCIGACKGYLTLIKE